MVRSVNKNLNLGMNSKNILLQGTVFPSGTAGTAGRGLPRVCRLHTFSMTSYNYELMKLN